MAWMRARVASVAAVWLALHVCLLVSVPTTLCSMGSVAAAGSDCSCPHAAGTICPMHPPKAKLKPSSDQCACKSAMDPSAAITTALLGPAAVLSPASSPVAPPDATAWRVVFAPVPLDSISVPDSPPPRA
jgi:hypothetical protein